MRREPDHISALRQSLESSQPPATIQLTIVSWIVAFVRKSRLDAAREDVDGFAKPGITVEVG